MLTLCCIVTTQGRASYLGLFFCFMMEVSWCSLQDLFVALGARTIEGKGSRVRFVLNEVVGTFHQPHPAKEAKPYQVRDARVFLETAGVKP